MTIHLNSKSRKSACLIICVINEGNRLTSQLESLKKFTRQLDIVIVDKHSTDGSTSPKLLTKFGVKALIRYSGSGFYSSQLRAGLRYAQKYHYPFILTMDGNAKDDVSAIPLFLSHLHSGFDFIQASRFLPGASFKNTPSDRIFAIRHLAAPLITFASKFTYTDPANGFKAFRTDLLSDPRLQPFRPVFTTYNLQYYLVARLPRLGYRVCELPAARTYPPGLTPSKITTPLKKLAVLKDILSVTFGLLNPPDGFGYLDRWLSRHRQLVALKHCPPRSTGTVVDLGCDAHFPLKSLLPPTSRYIGIDYHLSPYIAQNIRLIRHSLSTPFPLRPLFPPVTLYCLAVIEHLSSPQKFLRRLSSTVPPSSRLILTTPASPLSPLILKSLSFFHLINRSLIDEHKACLSQKDLYRLLITSGWKPLFYRRFFFSLNSLILAQKTAVS